MKFKGGARCSVFAKPTPDKPQRAWAIALGLVLVSGCATAPSKPVATSPGPDVPKVMAKFERRLADGRLYVAANLKNASAAAEHGIVSCDFTDGNGHAISSAPAAIRVSLAPGEVLTVHFEAPSTAASEGTVSITP